MNNSFIDMLIPFVIGVIGTLIILHLFGSTGLK